MPELPIERRLLTIHILNLAMNTQALVSSEILDNVGVIRICRPSAKNALCMQIVSELTAALDSYESNESVNVILLCGDGGVFAAGADIKEMLATTLIEATTLDFSGCCTRLATVKKPVIAAVDGYALGGGCELVEMCDIVIASERAVFGHPEVLLGTIPGAGGTQRLPKAVGKHVAMDLLLTARQLSAFEAYQCGLVSRVVQVEELQLKALEVAKQVAAQSGPVTRMIKEAVRHSLHEGEGSGFALERKLFHLTFALKDREEGMRAFVERRRPVFQNR